ncbi:MAG: hypothetical protein IJM15_01465 [Erysipelotrichaceae bacterium]|nr:hypothetical protein [Erysipelotrichaceae bacterium]
MKKGILFDLDGVLVNSEVEDQRLNVDFMNLHGYKSDPKIFWLWIGSNPKLETTSVI